MRDLKTILLQEAIRSVAIWAIAMGILIPLAQVFQIDAALTLLIIAGIAMASFIGMTILRRVTGRSYMATSEQGQRITRIVAVMLGIVLVLTAIAQQQLSFVLAIPFTSLVLLTAYLLGKSDLTGTVKTD